MTAPQRRTLETLFYEYVCEIAKILKYLSSALANEKSIQEEMTCRLKAGNSCCYSVQAVLSPLLLSKNLKIKIYKTIKLSVVLHVFETLY